MKKHYRVTRRPSKAGGIFGTLFCGVFVLIGLFVAIPAFGLFGVLWTALALGMTVYNAYAAFGKNKDGSYNEYMGTEIDIEHDSGFGFAAAQPQAMPASSGDAQARLQQLERLRESGLITEAEYEDKRAEIIRDL